MFLSMHTAALFRTQRWRNSVGPQGKTTIQKADQKAEREDSTERTDCQSEEREIENGDDDETIRVQTNARVH